MKLISRADAVKAIRKCKFESVMPSDWYRGMECAQDIVEELPSAEADWIPVSEGLPSEDGDYLVCKSWEYHGMDVLQWVDGWNCYRGYDGKINRESEIDGADILAWMPLPKPYKGGDTE